MDIERERYMDCDHCGERYYGYDIERHLIEVEDAKVDGNMVSLCLECAKLAKPQG